MDENKLGELADTARRIYTGAFYEAKGRRHERQQTAMLQVIEALAPMIREECAKIGKAAKELLPYFAGELPYDNRTLKLLALSEPVQTLEEALERFERDHAADHPTCVSVAAAIRGAGQ